MPLLETRRPDTTVESVRTDADSPAQGYGACRNCRCPSFGGGSWRDFCNHLYCHHHRDAHR